MPAKKGNLNEEKHGGAGAIKAIEHDTPMHGLAAVELQAVQDEYKNNGAGPLVELNALRLQTASNLYWNAIQKAAQDGDIVALTGFFKVWVWVTGSTLRALEQLTKLEHDGGKRRITEAVVLAAYRSDIVTKDGDE